MTRIASMLVALSLLVAVGAEARGGDSREGGPTRDWARVVSSTPVTETLRVVTPRRECWTERV